MATRMPLWESFLSHKTLTPVFCVVRRREMRTLLFVFNHEAPHVDLTIRSAQILFSEYCGQLTVLFNPL